MKVSFFINRWKKDSTVISLSDFVNDVRGPRWKVLTEAHRRYLAEGRLKEAGHAKDIMNGIVATGTCHGGHAAAQVVTLSGWMMLDFDHVGDRTQEVFALLCTLPYVGVAFISISGQGIKVLVRVDVENAVEYATAYAIVGSEVSAQADVPYDKACSDLGRICSAVHDPNVYFNPDALPFDWRNKAPQLVPAAPFPPSLPEAQARTFARQADALTEPEQTLAGQAEGFVQAFLYEFAARNVFVKGSRHSFMLKLGRVARYKGFSQSELEKLTVLATSRFSESDYLASEGAKDILAGYQYINLHPKFENEAVRVQKVQGSPMNPFHRENQEGDAGELSEKSNELRASMPTFPKEIFALLPDLLQRALSVVSDARERDMLLMGMMANLSVCLPHVRFQYGGMEYSPHLYFAGVAPAGTGKGVVALAAYLAQPLHEQYTRQAANERKAYEQKKRAWDLEVQAAFRAKRQPDATLQPEEPRAVCLVLPANTSKARTYAHLRDNGSLGAIINATEINTMVSALGQDYGKQDDVYCAAAHHEDISSSFKVDGLPIFVREPRLGMCMTGTPNQFVALIRSLENGLYSRFGILTAASNWVWRSAAPVEGRIENRTFFRELGKEVQEIHNLLLQSPTEVTFTPAQWAEHTERFTAWLQGVVIEGDDSPGAIILRHGLYVMRLAAVLTTLRKAESKWFVKEYICTDEDFHIAMSMVEVLIEHSLLISSSLPDVTLKARALEPFHRVSAVLTHLSSTFSYTDFVTEAMKDGMSESTAKRILKRAVKLQFLVNKSGMYSKWTESHGEKGS